MGQDTRFWAEDSERVTLQKLRAEHARFRQMLEAIAESDPSEADQCAWWARNALDGKDINGRPLGTPSGSEGER
jgi:hypothetical protein